MHTSTFGLRFGSLSPAVTLKIRPRSPKPNQLIMSECYIHANLVKIHPPVHEISCKQESVTLTLTLTPTPTGSAPKTIFPLPFGGGHNCDISVFVFVLEVSFRMKVISSPQTYFSLVFLILFIPYNDQIIV